MTKGDRAISRRTVLGSGVTLGAAAGLTRVPPVAATSLVPIAGPAKVGATFDLYPFKPGTTYPQAVKLWNDATGTTMRCWKIRYKLHEFPTYIDARLATIIDYGIQALVSFRPAIHTESSQAVADKRMLAAAVRMFHKHNLQAEMCLGQDVGPKEMTAKQYHEYVAYYGPVIREYYPLVFNASGCQGPTEWAAYNPGHRQLDGYAVDFYCGDYVKHQVKLDKIMDLAGKLPVGLWEIGNTASPKFVPTVDQVDDYMSYITSTLSWRLAMGLPVGSVAWYNGSAVGSRSGHNEMVGARPCKRAKTNLADYRKLYARVNGKYPT